MRKPARLTAPYRTRLTATFIALALATGTTIFARAGGQTQEVSLLDEGPAGARRLRLVRDPSGVLMSVIGVPGNASDTNGLGSVPSTYMLGVYEVTNPQYLEMLNAVGADDTYGLFSDLMTSSDRGGILRAGTPGNYTYSLKPNFSDKPVGSTTWLDAARFCNWLHNGKPTGAQDATTTEDGAYDLSLPLGSIARKPGARYFIPTHDEWYKGAYFDPFDPDADDLGTPDYWLYPTRSDVLPTKASADPVGNVSNPGRNVANTDRGADWNDENGNVTTVGSASARSAWGLFDLGGNMNEVTETPGTPIPPDDLPTRRLRGGDFANMEVLMGSPAFLSGSVNMVTEGANVGFRIGAPFGSAP